MASTIENMPAQNLVVGSSPMDISPLKKPTADAKRDRPDEAAKVDAAHAETTGESPPKKTKEEEATGDGEAAVADSKDEANGSEATDTETKEGEADKTNEAKETKEPVLEANAAKKQEGEQPAAAVEEAGKTAA